MKCERLRDCTGVYPRLLQLNSFILSWMDLGLTAMCNDLVETKDGAFRFERFLVESGRGHFINDFRFWREIQKFKSLCHAQSSVSLVQDKVWRRRVRKTHRKNIAEERRSLQPHPQRTGCLRYTLRALMTQRSASCVNFLFTRWKPLLPVF